MWRILLFEVIVVILAVGVWLGAPFLGIKSVAIRVLIILALVLPPLIYFIFKALSERKAASDLEDGMKEQAKAQRAAARPDRQEEIDVLAENFEEAIAALKRSQLGRGKGTALYALPWYMIIGPPAAGKSTALLRSGLNFPYTSSSGKSIKGVGGTRNCDWWFSDQAILLDTAGRYTSEDEDLDEWRAFLNMLKRYRRKRPLNGLIVCISIADLLTATPADLEETAAKVRSRVDQVLAELEVVLPVYVMFTKCDLLSGFVEYFGDLKRSSRAQVLGFTVPLTGPKTDIEELFDKEFALLSESLRKRAIGRLAEAKTHLRPSIYQFPLQLAAARDPLAAFLKRLLMHNPYQDSPRLRGIYFCSGTQEGRPLDRVMATMSRALGLREAGPGVTEERSVTKSYFLHDVFTKVLFPDEHMAGRSAVGRTRAARIRLATFGVGVLASILVLICGITTFSNNRELVTTSLALAQQSRLRSITDPTRVTDSLMAVDKLGEHMTRLASYRDEGPPLFYRFGFYSGNELVDVSKGLFAKRMWRLFGDLTAMELEASLYDVTTQTWAETEAEAARSYDLLKTYLMVTEPKRLDVSFALPILLSEWKKRLHPDVAKQHELLARTARWYLELRKEGRAHWSKRDENLVAGVRRVLIKQDVEYKRLVGTLEKTLAPFTLRDVLQGRVQTVIKATYEVPGVYTSEGWNKYIKKRIAKRSGAGTQIEPWVLGEDESSDPADILRNRYFSQYIEAWQRFLQGLSVDRPSSPQEALQIMERLTSTPPLYEILFTAVVHNTDFSVELDGEKLKKLSGELRGRSGRHLRTAERLGLDKTARAKLGEREPNAVEKEFLPLRRLVAPPPGIDGKEQVSGLTEYLKRLERVREELTNFLGTPNNPDSSSLDQALTEANRVTRLILTDLPSRLRTVVSPLFYDPLQSATGNVRQAESAMTSSQFATGVCDPFNRKLAGKYPFAGSATDSLLQDVRELLSPQGGTVWSYYETALKSRLELRGELYQVKPGKNVPDNILSFINKAWGVTRALFPPGSQEPGLAFDVRPHPAILAEGAGYLVSEITLEIDGTAQVYRNGPRDWWTFSWPGRGRKAARLSIQGSDGLSENMAMEGDWALLRLFEKARVQRRGNWYTMEWSLKRGKIRVQMDFKPHRSDNPILLRSTALKGSMTCN